MPFPRPAPGTGRWWVVGVVGCTVAAALATWLALANTLGQVTWDVTGYKVVDDATVTVDFDVHRPSHTAVTCRVTALDSRFGTVGTLDVAVPGSTQGSVHERVTVRTTSRAVTGTIKECTPSPALLPATGSAVGAVRPGGVTLEAYLHGSGPLARHRHLVDGKPQRSCPGPFA